MKQNLDKFWRLDSPSMCRDFLKSIRMGPWGGRIEYLQQADGKQISIDDATDEQVLQVAREFAEAFGSRKK